MPFKNKAQEKACYATNGFGGKVNCKEFGSHKMKAVKVTHKHKKAKSK